MKYGIAGWPIMPAPQSSQGPAAASWARTPRTAANAQALQGSPAESARTTTVTSLTVWLAGRFKEHSARGVTGEYQRHA
jgi:hypothetical protein